MELKRRGLDRGALSMIRNLKLTQMAEALPDCDLAAALIADVWAELPVDSWAAAVASAAAYRLYPQLNSGGKDEAA